MAARAEMLGDTGENHPDKWVDGFASPTFTPLPSCLPAMPRRADVAKRSTTSSSRSAKLSSLDLEATPPFDNVHDHFGYRDRFSQSVIKGTGEMPTPGSGAPLKRVNSSSGTWMKRDRLPICHSRKFFLAMAATWAFRRLQEHVGKF